ncbi:MAG: hypothetical protein HFI42_00935 [Lachnospiraceae bacterium]|nr:hypothetical protein [Lachnospiraceae bacterium]
MIGKKAQWYMRGSWWRRLRLNRKYKDHLFRFLFRDKKDLLDLYNALNGTDYTQSDELEIVTMEDVIFLKMKNDLSFIIAGKLNLYEHQSSVNSNMPLRGFLYFAQQYEGLVSAGTRSIYGKKRIELPTPEYVVFYNGMDILEDQMELYLSDSYAGGRGSGCLECRCRVLNINRGHNGELVEKCRRLWEYSECVSEVNEWIQKGKAREEAIQLAIDYCIEKDILRDILVKQRAEVLHMLLTEFDEKKFKKTIYTDGYEDGERAGYDKGYSKGEQAGYSKGEQDMLKRLIRNKQQLGKDAAAIAQELGVEPDVIEKIWESL